MANLSALEPLDHSVLEEDLDGEPTEGLSVPELLEHSVLEENLERQAYEGAVRSGTVRAFGSERRPGR